MCGICGFAGRGEIRDLRRMHDALIHRGPDDKGLWHDSSKGIFLGHRRLSIIDLEYGKQPMWSRDGSIGVVFNGEIYNHGELRIELEKRGHRFQTNHSDTEVLIYGYREWGKDLNKKLNGMWAFAIYDMEKEELFLSRDRFGKKPLYYSLQNGTFAFASELASLVKHRNLRSDICGRSLKKYFAYGYIPAPLSVYENVYKLPGGCNLFFELSGMGYFIERYWDFELEPFERIPKNPEMEWGEELRELLFKAVKRRLIADVPLGVFLSGGMDSSLVAAYATRIVGNKKIKTFTIGFEEGSFDESGPSWMVASILGSEHHSEILSLERARSLLPEIVERLDEPMGDSSLLPTYLLCRETRKHVTVAVGGDGADELFAGYDPFRVLKTASLYDRLIPKPLHEGIKFFAGLIPVSHNSMPIDFKIKRALRGLDYNKKIWPPVWLGPLSPAELEELFDDPIDIEDLFSETIEQWDACRQENMIDKVLQFYTKLYLQDNILVKTDRASMMNSLEVRSPYLDIDLVDFVRRIPGGYKYRKGKTKYILKKALEPLLPYEILHRPKKGFGVPTGKWFMDGQLEFRKAACPVFLNRAYLEKRLSEHQRGIHDHRAFLWNQWILDLFCSSNSWTA